MPHAFWRGSISFGLVEIGVALRPATGGEGLSFTLLDRKDFSPVGNRRYNKNTGEEVPWERIVRGYEYEPDQYVVLTDDELKAANFEASQTIDLVAFVDKDAIDPIYYDTPYYVDPRGRSSRSYQLLLKALEETGLVGIAKVVLRTRQHVAALEPRNGQLVLVLLRYQEELRDARPSEEPDETEELARGKGRAAAKPRAKVTPPSAAELRMATRLIEEMKEPWKPEEFKDEYRDDVLALVEKKVKEGKTHEVVVEAAPRAEKKTKEVVDLMPLLKESLERRGPRKSPRKAAGREREEARPEHRRRRASGRT